MFDFCFQHSYGSVAVASYNGYRENDGVDHDKVGLLLTHLLPNMLRSSENLLCCCLYYTAETDDQ